MLRAAVTLDRPGMPRVALARMELLQAVGTLGSISAAAKQVGLSYKGAWDAVQALNNLFDAPLIAAAPGGRAGGAASLTEKGREVLAAMQRMQAELDAALAKLDRRLDADIFWSLGMKTSARNALRGRVRTITPGAVSSEVILDIGDGVEIVAILTARSVDDLSLKVGDPAVALIQAGSVILAQGEGLKTSARNHIPAVVVQREDGAVNTEITLQIAPGKTLAATVTLESARALDLAAGAAVTALIKAPHVILAVE